jgi:hypothetical protein
VNLRKQQEAVECEAGLRRLEEENYHRAVAESLSLIPTPTHFSSPPASSLGVSSSHPHSSLTVSELSWSTSFLVQGLPMSMDPTVPLSPHT